MSNKATPTVRALMKKGLVQTEAEIAALVISFNLLYGYYMPSSFTGIRITPLSYGEIAPYLLKLSLTPKYKPVIEAFLRGIHYFENVHPYRDRPEEYMTYLDFNLEQFPELLQELQQKEIEWQLTQANKDAIRK